MPPASSHSAGGRRSTTPHQVPRSTLIDEDPRETISRILAREEDRLARRRAELVEMRNALVRLHDLSVGEGTPAVAPITVELAPTLLRSLTDETTGPIRNATISTEVGSAMATDYATHAKDAIRGGHEQRTLYDAAVLESQSGLQWAADWAAAGEQQRMLTGVPSEFAVYGESAVVATEIWGDPRADYVVVRHPMIVQAFIGLFDRLWAEGAPLPSARSHDTDDDDHLLELLSRGLKDEAIARYLGWSLRTVRRRVARLMDDLVADTRFQLGAQAVASGRLETDSLSPRRVPRGRG